MESSALPWGTNKVPGQIEQGGGPDSARRPCVCHLWCTEKHLHRRILWVTDVETELSKELINLHNCKYLLDKIQWITLEFKYFFSYSIWFFLLAAETTASRAIPQWPELPPSGLLKPQPSVAPKRALWLQQFTMEKGTYIGKCHYLLVKA